ncbi:hypothetical protein BKI52_19610 [marine bacterium AO1-C]|nr:hypothetical protein BKI52_19610 [marine bacterium AO1-C]
MQQSMEEMMAQMSQALFPNGDQDIQAGAQEFVHLVKNAVDLEGATRVFMKSAFISRFFAGFSVAKLQDHLVSNLADKYFNECQLKNYYRYLYSLTFVDFLYQKSPSQLSHIPGADPATEAQFYMEESWTTIEDDGFEIPEEYRQTWLKLIPKNVARFCLDGVKKNPQAVDLDEIPGTTGKFGLEVTNPIPTFGVPGIYLYLHNLHLPDGQATKWERTHAVTASNIATMIDEYKVYDMENNFICNLYLTPYHKKVSEKAPEGFQMHPDFGLMLR